jgi:hypothetical protein
VSAGLFNSLIAIFTLGGLAWFLYRPKVQASATYKAMVVPLANIMDVGFIVLSPIIVVLVGYDAPWVMLGLCLLAIFMGFAISYNINNYEPLVGKPDKLHRWNSAALWSLVLASVANIAYYALLLMTLVLLPIGDLYSPELASATAAALLAALMVYGFVKGLAKLNDLGNKTTAFNLAAIVAVLVAFAIFNIQRLVGTDFDWPDFNAPNDAETFRKVLGLFALVQGFEASRYLGAYFSTEVRIKTMRSAQYIASIVFVLFVALSLILFATVKVKPDAAAIFTVSSEVSVFLPFLIMAAALGSELSAIVNATESRTDMLAQQVGDRLTKRWTFPLLLVPTILVVLLTDVTSAVALASRVFAVYYLLQAYIAGRLAWRAKKWGWVAVFVALGLAMGAIAVFGIPS